ncbi:MAG: DUF4190 domain-containing protein, partial [Planctomycetales bacterium]
GQEAKYQNYRALCSAAVTSVLFGLLSAFAFLSIYLCIIPLLGILMGIFALFQIRQRSDELVGKTFAVAGIALSSLMLITSMAYITYVYLTEVPVNHERINYRQLQPVEGSAEPFPPRAEDLDGEKVFIKGYVYPGAQHKGIKQFLLVRDRGDCCFGGNPKVTDRIQVTLADPLRLNFSTREHKVAGTFRVERKPASAVDAGGSVFYYLDDCILR